MTSGQRKIELTNGRSLIAGFSVAKLRSRDWIVFLPESGSEFHAGRRAELNRLIGATHASRFHFLAINKPGLSPRGSDPKAFERSFRRYRRVEDALTTLRAVIPKTGRIYLIGYSEGAYLAPEIARRDRRICSVVMIGGGTRGWLKEEVQNARKASDREMVRRQIREIRRNSRSLEKWQGFSYATWNSYREDSTLAALKRLDLPVLSILGSRDRVIDMKSTLKDLSHLAAAKKPVELHVLKRCGHSFNGHWQDVQKVVAQFLQK